MKPMFNPSPVSYTHLFYAQLMEQKFAAVSAAKDKKSVTLRGKIENIGNEKLDEIFEKNSYMQQIYPSHTRSALEVFPVSYTHLGGCGGCNTE